METVSSSLLDSLVFSRILTGAFDFVACEVIFNLCACCSKVCLFSINSASAINCTILIFSSSDLSSLDDLWLEFVDCLLLDLDEYLLIHLTNDVLCTSDTSESLELTAALLSASRSFIQSWIFCYNAHRLCSTSSNLSSSVFPASGCSIEFYSLCTSNIILKNSAKCCIQSRRDSTFLKECSIHSAALDFHLISLSF